MYEDKQDWDYGFVRTDIEPLLPARAERVLEVGCGAGGTLAALKSSGRARWVAGIELSVDAAALARPRLDVLHVTFDQVLDLAKRSETAIYAIWLRAREELLGKGFKEADFVMRELARQTGGRSFFPSRIEDLSAIYSQIAEELSSQYMVGYMSKNTRRDGSWRRVVVRVNRPGVTPRTKQGYFAPAPK